VAEGTPLSRYLSPAGAARMRAELNALLHEERPKIVEIVSWAAGNGDRSENGDYIYGKRRLREIDRRVRFLSKRLDQRYVDEDETEHSVTILGCDEADMAQRQISLVSPVARALMRARVGDEVAMVTPGGTRMLEVLSIAYP
jgi:transcription elongation factor GreB